MLALLLLASCEAKPKFFDTKVTLKSIEVVSRDVKTNAPQLIEIQVEYPECPGDQLTVASGLLVPT